MEGAPLIENTNYVNTLVQLAKKPSSKRYDFFILYQSKGIDGHPLADAEFAEDLQVVLRQEKLVSGKKAMVGKSSENIEDMKAVFREMSASVVILVVLSEAALQTFGGNVDQQNNYLLLMQFALKLHDTCGARILGLNIAAVDDYEGVRSFVKFQGWMVRFSDVDHPSIWIQDGIAKSMRRLFAIQGINIDLEDWKFKVPTLFASYYASMDDLNASSWTSVHRIIPWQAISGLLFTFIYSFILPVLGLLLNLIYWKFSHKSERHKTAHFNTSLFATGLVLMFISTGVTGFAIFTSAQGALCSSDLKCEVMIRAGNRWSLWRDWASSEGCVDYCYPNDPTHSWSQDFDTNCAACVCYMFRQPEYVYSGQKSCASNAGVGTALITVAIFVVAFVTLCVAVNRLQKQAFVAIRQNAVYKVSKNGALSKV